MKPGFNLRMVHDQHVISCMDGSINWQPVPPVYKRCGSHDSEGAMIQKEPDPSAGTVYDNAERFG